MDKIIFNPFTPSRSIYIVVIKKLLIPPSVLKIESLLVQINIHNYHTTYFSFQQFLQFFLPLRLRQ